MFRALPSLACLFSVAVTPSLALAQSNVAAVPLEANDSGYVSLDQEAFSGGVTWNGTYFDVRNQSGSGMGYTHGFTQFGAFRPFWMGDDAFIALNGRLNVMGNGDWGFNSGLVARRLANDANRFYGANIYYDRDRTYRGNNYTQFGFGIETLGESWDFRANGYIPTGTDTNNLGVVGLSSTPYFFGNRIGFLGYERFEQALSGGDFEFGIPLLPDTSWLRGYAGMYAYQQDLGEDPVGFRGRIEGWVSDDLSVGVQVTHDKQFDTYVNAMVDWRFAGFKPTRYFPNLSTRERMLMPVQRQWRVTVGEYVDTKDVLAINPRDDVPYFVVWVDNSNTGPGDGTYENPYTTLPGNTLPNETDLLLVRRGNTTQANPLSGNVVLPDYARMLGEGKAHVFDAYANFGSFTATLDNAVLPDPAFTNSGAYPFLSSNLGPIVTLGDHNEVSAFVMRGANGAAIRGFGTNGFHLNNLEIAGNLGGGIVITNATASGNITADGQVIDGALITNINRNTVVGYTPIIPGAGNNGIGGIVIDSGAGGLELTISQVSMNATPGGQAFGVRLFADSGDIELLMDDVHTNGGNTVAGVSLESAGRVFLADVVDLESRNNLGSGVDVLGDGAGTEMRVNLFDPLASGNDTYGLQVIATNGAQIGNPLTSSYDGVNVIDGNFSASGLDAISVFADGGSNVDLFVDPTVANFASRHGLRFEVSGGSTFTGRFEETNFNNAGSDATVLELDGPGGLGRGIFGLVDGANSVANVLLLDSTATTAGDDGMYIGTSFDGRANVTVTNTNTLPTFDNAGRAAAGASAVEVSARTGGDAVVTLNNATGNFTDPTTNNDSGLTVNATDGGSTTLVQVTNGGFNNAGVNALSVGATNFGRSQVFLDNTNGNNAGADAVVALASGGSRVDLSLDTGEFDNAGQLGVTGAGLRGEANFGATLNICVMDTQFNGALDQGIDLYANNSALIRTHLENGSANGNGLEGLRILSESNAGVHFRAVDYTFDGNGLVAPSDGVYVRADAAGALVGFFSSAPPTITTSANNNTGNGFNFEAVNGALLTAHLDTVEATGNDGFGIRFDASGAGTDTLLLMQGTNNISGNTAGNYSLNYNGVDNAIVTLTGSFNNSGTSGVEVDITNATNAFVSILGNGTTDTIDNNTLHGVDVRITNAQQAGVVVAGYSSISNNGIDGVNIVLQDIAVAGAVDVLGIPTTLTDMFDNGDDGVDVTFIDSAMGPVDGTVLTDTLPIITINSNVSGILNDCLPLPVDVSIDDVAVLPTSDGVLIQDMNIAQTVAAPADPTVNGIEVSLNGVTGTGIVTVANNVIADMYGNGIYTAITNNTDLGGAIYANNTISGNLFGDGVRYEQTGGSVDLVAVLDTTAVENAGYGINVDLNGVAGNTVTAPSVAIDGSDVRDNTGRGLQGSGIFVNAVDTALETVQITNSTFVSGNFGDGIRVFGDNSPITTLNISDNANISSNSMNGINVGLINGSDVTDLIIDNNVVNSVTPPPLPNNSFNIDVDTSSLTPQQAAIFQAAAQRWEQIIVGDLPDVGLIDDLSISASIVAIDGVGGILGAAGPTGLRGGSFIPYSGDMIFDSADVANLIANNEFDEVILHEMGHVLGFGTIWSNLGLLSNAGTTNPRYTGALATAEYNARFGVAGASVPVEGLPSGPGTADAHWRESVFINELMTGFLDSGVANPISRITVAQFADLGYTVDITQADAYIMASGSGGVDGNIIRPSYVIGPNTGLIQGALLNGGGTANISANTSNGIHINLDTSDVVNLEITRNQIANNGLNGVLLESLNSTLGDVTIDRNTITDSLGGDGVQLDLDGSPITGVLTLSNNLIGGSNNNGVNLIADNNSDIADLQVLGNVIGGGTGGSSTSVDDSLPVIRAGFNANSLAANDDGSTGLTPFGFSTNYFGTTYTGAYLNNNGNITFNNPLATFTPFNLLTTAEAIIAPFFADVDTRGGSNLMTYGAGTVGGRQAFGVTWDGVRFFSATGGTNDIRNEFQLVLVDRSDIAPGDFDFEFNYEQVLWETGTASGGDNNGLGGSSARAGYSNGVDTFFELPGSAVNGALLDGGPAGTSLVQNSLNSMQNGRYVFFARNGGIGVLSPSGDDGINIDMLNGSDIANANFDGNTIQANGIHGVDFNINNSDLGPVAFTENVISDQGTGDGVSVVSPTDTNNTLDFTFARNTIANNGNAIGGNGRGVNFDFTGSPNGTLNATFENDSITGNNQEGINVNLVNSGATSAFVGNVTINSEATTANPLSGLNNSDISGNGAPGLRIEAAGTNNYNLLIGGDGDQNTFDGNVDAGVAIRMANNATGTIDVSRAIFSGTTDGTDGDFDGDGFALLLQNNASVVNAVWGDAALDNTEFNGNAGDGLTIRVEDFSILPGATIQNVSADGNTGDGLNMLRSSQASITNALVASSSFTDNADGIDITASGVDAADTYTFRDNLISDNNGRGISLFVEADADINTLIQDNEITLNGSDGIQMSENADITDTPQVVADIFGNTISDNTGNGINILARHQVDIGDGTLANANEISGNGLNGISITGPSFLNGATIVTDNINGNILDGNTLNGIQVNSIAVNNVAIANNAILNSGNDGVQLDSTGARLIATLTDNTIQFSGGDGVQFRAVNSGTTLLGPNSLTMVGNLVADSERRGVNILNAGTVNSTVNIGDDTLANSNLITRNDLEGIYVVNTSAETQNVDALASAPLAVRTSGTNAENTTRIPRLTLNVRENEIENNGQSVNASNFVGSSGLVLMVGTSDSGTDFDDPDGDSGRGSFALDGRGGVIATITNNDFSGQFGSDVTFVPFISTQAPATTTGTWTDQNDNNDANNVFSVTSYRSDPMARLDLVFTGNVGDGVDVSNSLAANAFYNNDESVFKSRTQAQDGTDRGGSNQGIGDDGGPFLTGTRRRNATRLAARAPAPFNQPTLVIGASDSFLYPGIAGSTFRRSAASTTAGFALGDNFGSAIQIGTATGEFDFVWGTFP